MTTVVGKSVPRSDAETKVRGEAIYGVDVAVSGMVHARLLRSPVPAGRIVELDTSRAEETPGVIGVFTAADAPSRLAGLVVRDQPLFAVDEVRYEGEPIAAVVADTPDRAAAGVEAIVLEIEPLEPIADVESSLAPGARLVHPEWESYEPAVESDHRRSGNVAGEVISDPDDIEAAFAEADLVVEDEYVAPRQYQAYMEPKNAVGVYEDGRYTIHVAHQYPFNIRDRVAQILGVRSSAIRVIGHHIGGGFGAKLDVGLEAHAALLAKKVGRPVKLVNHRQEDLLTCNSREGAVVRIRSAVSRSGEILGRDVLCLMDGGAYAGDMPYLTSIPMFVAGSVYRVGVARVVTRAVYTNTAPCGAFRGVGGTYMYFALERHMDHIANELGMDRRRFRLQNLFRDGDEMLNGQTLSDAGVLREAFDEIERVAPWDELSEPRPYHGVGLAAAVWLTNPQPGSATLKLNEDGTVGVVTGATENGSGAVAMGVTQIAAEALGIPLEDVVVVLPDTDTAAYDSGSQGSRTTHIVGRAVSDAAEEVRVKIFETAAGLLEASEQDLEIVEGKVGVVGDPGSRIPLSDVALAATFTTGPITGTASYKTPMPPYDPSCASGFLFPAFPTPTYHAHLAEVEVDPVTGGVTVLRYIVAQDVGKAINPAGVFGQIQGGVTQGLGYALYENISIADARYQERTLEQYRLPIALDIPQVETILLEHPDAAGPYGAKGVAEPPIVPVAAAIGNAVADAIGRPVDRIPITPNDIIAALREGNGEKATPS